MYTLLLSLLLAQVPAPNTATVIIRDLVHLKTDSATEVKWVNVYNIKDVTLLVFEKDRSAVFQAKKTGTYKIAWYTTTDNKATDPQYFTIHVQSEEPEPSPGSGPGPGPVTPPGPSPPGPVLPISPFQKIYDTETSSEKYAQWRLIQAILIILADNARNIQNYPTVASMQAELMALSTKHLIGVASDPKRVHLEMRKIIAQKLKDRLGTQGDLTITEEQRRQVHNDLMEIEKDMHNVIIKP